MTKKINISESTLKIIEGKNLKPIPKWEFVAKNLGTWVAVGICTCLLVLSIGVTWFGIADNIITPYLWLIIVAVFAYLSTIIFYKTKRGYRAEKWQVAMVIIFLGVIMGGMIYRMGMASLIDRKLENSFGLYRRVVPMKTIVWNNPEQGYLSGEIINLTSANNFQLKDFGNNIWQITSHNPIVRGRVKLEVGEQIKLVGKKNSQKEFVVEEIRPWNGQGQNKLKEN